MKIDFIDVRRAFFHAPAVRCVCEIACGRRYPRICMIIVVINVWNQRRCAKLECGIHQVYAVHRVQKSSILCVCVFAPKATAPSGRPWGRLRCVRVDGCRRLVLGEN